MARQCKNSWIESYLEFTRFQESPGKFHLWCALTLLSTALARKVWRERGFFKLYPNLYVGLIGPTGMGKSAAAEIGVNTFRGAIEGCDIIRGKVTSWYLYQWLGTAALENRPAVCTILASELKTLLGDINKMELVALLTDLYTCPDFTEYRTKTEGTVELKDVYLNVLACSTPEWLTLGLNENDVSGGFTGRFVYVCEDETKRSFPFPEDFYEEFRLDENKERLYADLQHIATLEGKVVITEEAKAKYVDWYSTRKEHSQDKDERLVGYYSRKRDHLLKVAILISVAEGDSLVVTAQHIAVAQSILKVAEEKMVLAFKGVVSDPALRFRETVLDQVMKEGVVTRKELLRRNANRMDKDMLMRILESLQAEDRVALDLSAVVGGRTEVMVRAV